MKPIVDILIVEDHIITGEGVAAALSREHDFRVVGTATDARSGLSMAAAFRPAVIVLDLHLPGDQSPGALVQSFSRLEKSKVVIFSGETRPVIIEAALSAGASAFVPKSESSMVLAKTIRAVLAGEKIRGFCPPQILMRLSTADRHILSLLARGLKYVEIAEIRKTTAETVRKQCDALQAKVDLDSREQLIAWAVENGYGRLENDALVSE